MKLGKQEVASYGPYKKCLLSRSVGARNARSKEPGSRPAACNVVRWVAGLQTQATRDFSTGQQATTEEAAAQQIELERMQKKVWIFFCPKKSMDLLSPGPAVLSFFHLYIRPKTPWPNGPGFIRSLLKTWFTVAGNTNQVHAR